MSNLMQKIVSLSKRRGFIFPSSEIYGGFASCYDYGPLGVELKNNIKKQWWTFMVQENENIVGLDASILMSPKVWEASGHLTAGFSDLLVECKKCHSRFRADHMAEGKFIGQGKAKEKNQCPKCGGKYFTEPRQFNLMMRTFVGPVEDKSSISYLRAETCQGIYVNYKNIKDVMRLNVPFGIAQIGKAFRNEITPGNFIFRMREFEQMEMQFFVRPNKREKEDWFNLWKKARMGWYSSLGIKKENLRFRSHKKNELAHYAKKAVDIEYKFPWGWGEIEGIHDRGDWDLSNHSKHSGHDLTFFNPVSKEKFIPHIIETSAGVDRVFLALLCDSYQEVRGGRTKTTKSAKELEVVLRLNKKIAPIKIAILPLVRSKPAIVKKARKVYQGLKPYFMCQYDEIGSIGRRYRRQDEIGTPYCVTVDFDTLENDTITIRDRDTMSQERAKIKDLAAALKEKLDE